MCYAKDGDCFFAVAEILALLRPHVLGSAGLRPHFFVGRPQKESAHTKSRPQKESTHLRAHFVT